MIAVGVAVAAPFIGALLPTAIRVNRPRRIARVACAALAVAFALLALPQLDALSALFVAIISLLSFAATVFSFSILPAAEDVDGVPWSSRPAYFVLLGAFWSSMLVAVTATTFAGLWIGISATTLATTFLVGFSGGKAALEAAWKYLMLCSFGIAIALIGILLVGRAGLAAHIAPATALSWDALAAHARHLPPELTRVALLLMVLGFGTKAGLVPMHSWLPDAHSKAPAPISALLSGLLVSCALYAILRVQHVAAVTAASLVDTTLLVAGGLSVLVAGTLMLAQRDVKRLLSYSTVEHAGLVAIALGLGTPLGEFAAIYHIVNHAFTKSLAFLAVGIVAHERGTTAIGKLHGLWNGGGGRFLLVALIGLMGLPPLGIFVSELLIVVAAAAAHAWAALFCALAGVLLAFAALVRLAIDTESGNESASPQARRIPLPALFAVSCAATFALLLAVAPFLASTAKLVAVSPPLVTR
jgi:hydrogenase-4 component F